MQPCWPLELTVPQMLDVNEVVPVDTPVTTLGAPGEFETDATPQFVEKMAPW
jgi:hypothetical protein